MAASVDDIMSAAEMRPILALSKREPVSVSLGLTSDKSAAVLLSKKLAPKKVRSQMRSEAKKLKLEIESSSIRFGLAVVDEEDGGLLLFRVNKAPPGALVTKVRERMRKANWSKIEFVVDESLDEAPEEEAEESEAAPDTHPAATTEEAKPAATDPGTVMYVKSRQAWMAARKKIEGELEKLKTEIMTTFAEEGLAGAIDVAYRKEVAPVLATLDERLAVALEDATNAADAAVRAKHVADARAIMGEYAQYLGSSRIIADLDTNPFIPIAIKATIGGTLSALSKAVH